MIVATLRLHSSEGPLLADSGVTNMRIQSAPLVTLLFTLLLPASLAVAAPKLPVLIPGSSWRVTSAQPGTHAHTRVRILVTANATEANATEINTPNDVRAAYQLPSTGGAGAIAIVDSYHFPTALSDFNSFAKTFGLPTETSKKLDAVTNHVFEVVYATGRKPLSGGSYIAGWNLEAALDIEWAHAIAPSAKIYLVEARSDSMTDLLYAVQVASNLPNVREVSMSWGSDETNSETSCDWVFTTSNVTYFAAGGDQADAQEYPSASPNVISVGGTSLNRDDSGNLLSETGWSDTGCGLSLFEARPDFQGAVSSSVGNHRGSNDVSFLADPNTGVFVYDSTKLYGESGWWIVGGTSLGTPSWAGVANLAAASTGAAANSHAEGQRLYGNLGNGANFRDITSGAADTVQCSAGWDQLTGVGSPIGLAGK